MSIAGLQSKDKLTSCTVESNWKTQESTGKKPDWQFLKSSFVTYAIETPG